MSVRARQLLLQRDNLARALFQREILKQYVLCPQLRGHRRRANIAAGQRAVPAPVPCARLFFLLLQLGEDRT